MAEVETQHGRVSGVCEESVDVFRGIPYAQPPVGDLRFRPPLPPESWHGVLDARVFGPMAPQPVVPSILPGSDLPQNEDCLTLNVWTPGIDNGHRAVLVWVHGGGLTSGSSADFYCNGHHFAKYGDVVFVSINYRLGALGFLHLGELLGANYETSGNNGLLDVIAALGWVHNNIEKFGGDASRVTVGGVSAGAKLVASLFSMPQAAGLFQQAILQSGAAQTIRDSKTATGISLEFLQNLALTPEEADKLLTLPVQAMLRAQQQLGMGAKGLHLFGPVRDGRTLTGNPFEIVANEHRKDETTIDNPTVGLPVLIGNTCQEFKLYTSLDAELLQMNEQTMRRMFGENSHAVLSAYRRLCETTPKEEAAVEILSDYVYSIASERFADGLAVNGCDVWRYRFDWAGVYGASHGQDVPFVWNKSIDGGMFAIPSAAQPLANAIHQTWISFIRNGNPNIPKLPYWPQYDSANRQVMILNETCQVMTLPEKRVEPGFLDEVYVN